MGLDQRSGASLLESFAEACINRRERILAALDRLSESDPDVKQALETMSVELHDHIGDANLISLREVSEAANDLESVVRHWHATLPIGPPAAASGHQGFQLELLRRWLDRLMDLSRQFAGLVEAPAQVAELQNLRLELARALDRDASPTKSTQRRTQPGPQLSPMAGQRSAMVLDDSRISAWVVCRLLERLGYKVQSARSLDEFWGHLTEEQPDLFFLDYHMPEAKGDAVCRELRQREGTRAATIIFFSSLAETKLAKLADEAGADGFASKQDGLEALQTSIEQLRDEGLI